MLAKRNIEFSFRVTCASERGLHICRSPNTTYKDLMGSRGNDDLSGLTVISYRSHVVGIDYYSG